MEEGFRGEIRLTHPFMVLSVTGGPDLILGIQETGAMKEISSIEEKG